MHPGTWTLSRHTPINNHPVKLGKHPNFTVSYAGHKCVNKVMVSLIEYSGGYLRVWAVCVWLWGHQKHQASSWVEGWIDICSSCWCTGLMMAGARSINGLYIQLAHSTWQKWGRFSQGCAVKQGLGLDSNIRCSCSCIYSLICSHVGLLELDTERKTTVDFFWIVTYLRCITHILYISGDS